MLIIVLRDMVVRICIFNFVFLFRHLQMQMSKQKDKNGGVQVCDVLCRYLNILIQNIEGKEHTI